MIAQKNPIFIDNGEDETGVTGYLFIRNPDLEKKYKDNVAFFHDPHKKERNLMFSGSIVDNLTDPDKNRLSTIHNVNSTGIKLKAEQLYVMDYLKKHPEVREKIIQDLKGENLQITEHLIIAKALIGDYLPKAFYALRTQAYITQFFCTYPYYNDYSKVEFKKFHFEEKSFAEYAKNTQRSIGLRVGCKEGIKKLEVGKGKHRFQEAVAPPDDPSYKKAYEALYDPKLSLNEIMLKREYDERQKKMGLLGTAVDKSQQSVKVSCLLQTKSTLFGFA